MYIIIRWLVVCIYMFHSYDVCVCVLVSQPVLNLKLKEMGLNDKQSQAVVIGLFEKFETCAFEGSGLSFPPCEEYFLMLTDTDCVTWGAL